MTTLILPGGPAHRDDPRTWKPTPIDVAAVVAEYQAGAGLRALSLRHHTTDQHIRAALVAAGVHIRTAGEIGAANCAKRGKV